MSTAGEWDGKPDVVPSNLPYVSRASRPEAGIVSVGTPEFCKYEGLRLRDLMATCWNVPISRVAFVGAFDEDARFDVVLMPPEPANVDLEALMRDGITTHFGFDVSFEDQPMDVLVLSAPDGIAGMGPPGGGGLSSFYASFELDEASMPALDQMRDELARRLQAPMGGAMLPGSPSELSLGGTATVDSIRDMLEHMQDRLVIDETGADGSFNIDIRVDGGLDALVAALRERGIETTPSRRDVRMLVVRWR